jgi:hypothetical protein
VKGHALTSTLAVFFLQFDVDRLSRHGALGSRHGDELYVARAISGGVYARDARGFQLVGSDGAAPGEGTPKVRGEIAPLMLACIEEYCATREGVAIPEDNTLQIAAFSFQPCDPTRADRNFESLQFAPLIGR